jgi:hypothetical protein
MTRAREPRDPGVPDALAAPSPALAPWQSPDLEIRVGISACLLGEDAV